MFYVSKALISQINQHCTFFSKLHVNILPYCFVTRTKENWKLLYMPHGHVFVDFYFIPSSKLSSNKSEKKDGLRDVMWTRKTCSVSLYQPHQFPHLLGWFNDRHFTSQLKQCDRLAAVSQGGAVKCFMMQREAIIINHVWLIGCGCITAQVWGGEGLKCIYLYCRNIQISRNKHYNSAVVGL